MNKKEEKELLKDYDPREGVGAAIYAILTAVFAFGLVIGSLIAIFVSVYKNVG